MQKIKTAKQESSAQNRAGQIKKKGRFWHCKDCLALKMQRAGEPICGELGIPIEEVKFCPAERAFCEISEEVVA